MQKQVLSQWMGFIWNPNNRKSQEAFICENCGHSDNADRNVMRIVKKRAINLIVGPGTESSKRGILLDSGRGAVSKTRGANASRAHSEEWSKNEGKSSRGLN